MPLDQLGVMHVDVIRMQAGATDELDDVLRSTGKPKAAIPARNPSPSGPLRRVHHDGGCHTGRIHLGIAGRTLTRVRRRVSLSER